MGSCLAIRLLEGDVRASHDDSHDGLREVGNVKRAEHGFRIVFLQVWMRYFGDYNVRTYACGGQERVRIWTGCKEEDRERDRNSVH